MSNTNNKLRIEVVLPASGTNNASVSPNDGTIQTGNNVSTDPKVRLTEIKNEVKGLQGQIKTLQREEKGIKTAQAKTKAKKSASAKKKKSGKK